ncbi:hypothetical protein SALBM217S_08364 [Streptomyces griseoloalbus]
MWSSTSRCTETSLRESRYSAPVRYSVNTMSGSSGSANRNSENGAYVPG